MAEQAGRRVAILGATSGPGDALVRQLAAHGDSIIAYSRSHQHQAPIPGVRWESASRLREPGHRDGVSATCCISVAPLWTLPEYLPALKAGGVRSVVAVSSTSADTKQDSLSPEERRTAQQLLDAESTLLEWGNREGIRCTILRPTLVHGMGRDRNITVIAQLIRRFGCFPLIGAGTGLRQPLHAADLAQACILAMTHPERLVGIHNVPGGETLSYREMVERVFKALGKRPRFLRVPYRVARGLLPIARLHPRWHHVNASMLRRMDQDLWFTLSPELAGTGFSPSGFMPDRRELGL